MGLRSLVPALLAAASLAAAQSFSDLSACGQTCINNMYTTTGCVPVTDECLCSNVNFLYGIADCANAACSAADAEAAVTYAKSSCASVLGASTSIAATPTSTDPTPTTTEASTTEASTTTQFPTTLSESATPTTSTGTTLDQDVAPVTTSSTVSSSAAEASATESSNSSGDAVATTSPSKTTGGAAVAATSGSSASDSDSDSATSAPELTTGAKVGIVIGSAFGAVALVAIALVFSRKRSKPLPRGTMKISNPLPGSGRLGDDDPWDQYHTGQYVAPPPRAAGRSNMAELDRHARPYEEMVPRMTPTKMV